MGHPLLRRMKGHATLTCSMSQVRIRDLPVQFDPESLEFTADFSSHRAAIEELEAVEAFASLAFEDFLLRDESGDLELTAHSAIEVRPQKSWSWLCDFWFGLEASDQSNPCLVTFAAANSVVRLDALAPLSAQHRFQYHWGIALCDVPLPYGVMAEGTGSEIFFANHALAKGVLCAFSDSDFSQRSIRIKAALELICGQPLSSVMERSGDSLVFYGLPAKSRYSYLPLLSDSHLGQATRLCIALMNGMLALSDEHFDKISSAQQFTVLGKNSAVPAEVRFLQLMLCVEAMDGRPTLGTEASKRLLGISAEAAFMLNSFRNQLAHGCGGYEKAFIALSRQQFKKRGGELKRALMACIPVLPTESASDWQELRSHRLLRPIEHQMLEMELALKKDGVHVDQCNFALLWLRLAERLDAFWCAYLGVPPELAQGRYSPLPVLSPVVLSTVLPEQEAVDSSGAKRQIEELLKKNKALEAKNLKLQKRLREQGTLLRARRNDLQQASGDAQD
ncbi:MAG: hypothetical protein ACK41V_02485 [Acidovorax sp.]|uniref:hypothetical protein n=1 Tax=Acidovorax sp. TaxID=1872122 RepID=UPI00391B885B